MHPTLYIENDYSRILSYAENDLPRRVSTTPTTSRLATAWRTSIRYVLLHKHSDKTSNERESR